MPWSMEFRWSQAFHKQDLFVTLQLSVKGVFLVNFIKCILPFWLEITFSLWRTLRWIISFSSWFRMLLVLQISTTKIRIWLHHKQAHPDYWLWNTVLIEQWNYVRMQSQITFHRVCNNPSTWPTITNLLDSFFSSFQSL